MRLNWIARAGIAALIVAVAIFRYEHEATLHLRKMDDISFLIFGLALLVLVLPWDQLKMLKAGPIELMLEKPHIQAAISGLALDRFGDEKLRRKLSKLEDELKIIDGSRVLWIDDKPYSTLGARRMMRALGIDVTTATSSQAAQQILDTDDDFDLIISDVQRKGENYKKVEGGIDIHDGVNFIVVLRQHPAPHIRKMPVIFFAAYDWERLIKFTRPARELYPEAQISNSTEDLILKAIGLLAEERSRPIEASKEKIPTRL